MKQYLFSSQFSSKDWLFQLAQQLPLSATQLESALNKLGMLPNKATWLQWLSLLFLALGSGLFLSGILFFFAYNWEELHRFSRFAVLLMAIVATAGATWWTGIDTLIGKLLLTAASVLTGVVLATFGMVYQTGADSYMLFRAWFILILPWVLISRFQPLWFIAFVIANTAIAIWITTMFPYIRDLDPLLLFALSVLSIIFLVVREFSTLMHPVIVEARWLPRLFSFWLLLLLSYVPFNAIIETSSHNDWQQWQQWQQWEQWLILLYLFVIGTLSYHAFIVRRDLLLLAAILLSVMTMLLTSFAQLLDIRNGIFLFFMMGLAIAGATVFVSKLLISIARKWKAEEALS